MPKAKNDIQDMSINDPRQNISVKITFYFNMPALLGVIATDLAKIWNN